MPVPASTSQTRVFLWGSVQPLILITMSASSPAKVARLAAINSGLNNGRAILVIGTVRANNTTAKIPFITPADVEMGVKPDEVEIEVCICGFKLVIFLLSLKYFLALK